jgi:osmoprotectant transport system substrate-binding protein
MRNHRMFVLGAGLLAMSLFATACSDSGGDDDTGGSGSASASSEPKPELTVGVSGPFAENQLVAEMYAQVLENAGYTVNRELEIADRAVGNEALASGDIDLKPEYTGFDLPLYDKKATTNGDPQAVADELTAAVAAEGLVTYAISPANSTNVFVTLPDTATANSLTDMSSLAGPAPSLSLGGPPDCPKATFCTIGLKDTYGVEFGEFKPLDFGGPKTVAALDNEAIDVGLLFSLDPTIADNGYVVLTDNENLQANGNFIPVVREEVASDELGALLDSVTTTLTDENMRDMVSQVQNDKRDVEDVASDYLSGAGII